MRHNAARYADPKVMTFKQMLAKLAWRLGQVAILAITVAVWMYVFKVFFIEPDDGYLAIDRLVAVYVLIFWAFLVATCISLEVHFSGRRKKRGVPEGTPRS